MKTTLRYLAGASLALTMMFWGVGAMAQAAGSAVSPRCPANAVAPTYAEGQFAPCSEDLNGNQRVTGTITATPPTPTPTPNSAGTITTGGTFQQLAASSTSRKSLDFQNKSGNGDLCWLYFGTTVSATTAKSIKVIDGQEYLRASGQLPSDAVQTTCTTTADAFYFAVQ